MHKFYSTILGLLVCATTVSAQDVDETLQFVFNDGTVVPSGSTITASTAETTITGRVEIKSGLYVKTNVESGGSYVSVAYTVDAPNGDVQLCYPLNCANINGSGETSIGMMRAGSDPQDLQSEWFPTAYGTATVTYTLKKYQYEGMGGPLGLTPIYNFLNNCATVTVKYVYADPAGINEAIANGEAVAVTYYDMAGRKVLNPGKGLFIKKAMMADGTVKTVKVAVNKE